MAVIEVIDTGIGIPPEHRDRVFDRFHRVPDARSRSHEGSGIGLALVADLIAAQGGSVAVAPGADDVGTTFTVTLPLAQGAPGELVRRSPLTDAYVQEILRWEDVTHPATEAGDLAEDAPRILFVDDNADMRDYVSGLLANHLDVEVVADGEQALEVLRTGRRFDIVLSDVMMPRLDGLGLLAAIRADEELRQMPVVLLSARAGPEASIEALDSGADDYVIKPFTATQLDARIRAVLRRSGRTDEDPVITVGGLRIDTRSYEVSVDGRPIELARKEFELLLALARRTGEVVSKRDLLAEVWQLAWGGSDRTVDVHLSWLRRKLGETAARPRYLHSVRGVGVRLVAPTETSTEPAP
jgi:DNA-binding response OmpR family regulator